MNNKINFVIWLVWMYRCFVCPVWIWDFAKFAHSSHPIILKPCTFTLVVVSQSFLCTCRTFYSIIYYWQAFAFANNKKQERWFFEQGSKRQQSCSMKSMSDFVCFFKLRKDMEREKKKDKLVFWLWSCYKTCCFKMYHFCVVTVFV